MDTLDPTREDTSQRRTGRRDMTRLYLYIAAAILLGGILIGLLISGAAGAAWGALLSLVGVGAAECTRQTVAAREQAEEKKEALRQQEQAAREMADTARKAREKKRKAHGAAEDRRLRDEAATLDVDGLLERAEREALAELEK